jgi:outer membrane biosynthesis protein TonB
MTASSRTCTALLVIVAAFGCAAKRAASPPADAAPATASAQVDALTEAEAELAANAAELNALGVKIAWGRRDKGDSSEPGRATEPSVEPETPTPEIPKADPIEPRRPGTKKPTKNERPDSVKPKPEPKPEPKPGATTRDEDDALASTDNTPCQRICTLASVACDLSKRICQLADDHQGDARYEDACWNAERQCEDASDACSDCTSC